MGYKSFTKRVLGVRIKDTVIKGNKTVRIARKTESGEDERDVSVDKLYNLNNSLIIVDEAHNVTNNTTGEALATIIKNSLNLKILLLTATPMKNFASDIIELINFLRPIEYPLKFNMVFKGEINSKMELKEDGIQVFKKYTAGYVSHIRGADPLDFAVRNEKGIIGNGLLFTKVTSCIMDNFQLNAYKKTKHEIDDALERASESISNFIFPGLSEDGKQIVGHHSVEGLNTVISQLKSNKEHLNNKLAEFLKIKNPENLQDDLISLSSNNKNISGLILQKQYIKTFSTKFFTILNKLEKLYYGRKGTKLAFIYSNLVKTGIDIFESTLLQNGYLEFQENQNYNISPSTICYFCGIPYGNHQTKKKLKINVKKKTTTQEIEIPEHKFMPATYLKIIGKQNEEEDTYEENIKILNDYFKNINNSDGKYIKFLLGSRVMNEGMNLKNIGEIHIIDVYWNLNRLDQVIGRGIRWCSHYKLMTEQNPFPKVNVYKYCITLNNPNELSSEELLYQKAELKYLLIKKIERAMKENAIDCPLNFNANVFKQEIKENAECVEPENYTGNSKNKMCPAICDYTKCNFKCVDDLLNNKFYDPDRMIYKNLKKNDLDYSTFTKGLAKFEIDATKKIIKELYLKGFVYELNAIVNYVKNRYDEINNDMFDEFFVYKALDGLIPITENDFNNYSDILVDKFGRNGYLIYVNKYYIFQSFSLLSESVPMYYRTTYNENVTQQASLYNYIKHLYSQKELSSITQEIKLTKADELVKPSGYEFDMDYYNNRDEFTYIGIIDKDETGTDVFRIRKKRAKILEKKRGTGIPTLKGAICAIAKHKTFLENLVKETKIKTNLELSKLEICEDIRTQLLEMEKYASNKNKNLKKITYVMIPLHHPTLPFPYNLEDRVEYIIKNIKDKIKGIKINTTKTKDGSKLLINKTDGEQYNTILISTGFKLINNNYEIIVD